jgi:hypothetical protein
MCINTAYRTLEGIEILFCGNINIGLRRLRGVLMERKLYPWHRLRENQYFIIYEIDVSHQSGAQLYK